MLGKQGRLIFVLLAFLGLLMFCGITINASAQECIVCHPEGEPIHDCLTAGCHDAGQNGNHHATGLAYAGKCNYCHQPDLVANYDQANNPYSYPMSITAAVLVQNCRNCHWAATDPLDEYGASYPHDLYKPMDCEHMAGVPLENYVNYNCVLCHGVELPTESYDFSDIYHIRYCEACHTAEKLHLNTAHVEDGYWYDENGDWNEITNRCFGCHDGTGGCAGDPDCRPNPLMLYVSQDLGTYDTQYQELTEADCRVCHGTSTADRHHYSETAIGCPPPPVPPAIDTDGCAGMVPVVGARNAEVNLIGTDFGDMQCQGFEVQVQEDPGVWVDIAGVTDWSGTAITWTLPLWTFTPYQQHEVRVQTTAGTSNSRLFHVLPVPAVSDLKDDTGADAQGPAGGWLKVHSLLDTNQPFGTQGTFNTAQTKWYEDSLGSPCANYFGATYVVSLTSTSEHLCAKIYDKWNKTGNQDFFKVRLENLWRDDDGDYYKDIGEPKYGPNGDYPLSAVPTGLYSVQVCLIIFADSNDNDQYSGDEDTIYQVMKSKSDVVYEINTDPIIFELVPSSTPASAPGAPSKVKIKGLNFGAIQGPSTLHVGAKTMSAGHPKIKLWSNEKIKFKVKKYPPPYPKYKNVWVTVNGKDSNKMTLEVTAP